MIEGAISGDRRGEGWEQADQELIRYRRSHNSNREAATSTHPQRR